MVETEKSNNSPTKLGKIMEKEDVEKLAKAFNKPVVNQITDERYCFCLYVAGTTPNSVKALRNLQKITEKYFPDNYELEVIDVYEQPEQLLLAKYRNFHSNL
jgi:circadian clock protein KaiB